MQSSETLSDASGSSFCWRWGVPALWTLVVAWFVMPSYPMMRPGFDVWWHLGAIEDPGGMDPSLYPPPRIYWHFFWHRVFKQLSIEDVFSRALIIHRAQFLLAFVLITAASYLLLSALTRRVAVDPPLMFCCSVSASVLWFVMLGTRSVGYSGGSDAAITQAWILWYSVTYQISLPLVITAMALTLWTFMSGVSTTRRVALLLGCFACLFLAFLIHMAELAYCLIALILLGLFFLRSGHGALVTLAVVATCMVIGFLALHYSYATPGILRAVSNTGLLEFWSATLDEGDRLWVSGATRIEYSWIPLHFVTFKFLLFSIGILFAAEPNLVEVGASLFVLSSSLFPLALFTDLGTGLFSLITHEGIAYRFSFANLLFIGPPLFCLVVFTFSSKRVSSTVQQIVVPIFSILVVFSTMQWERFAGGTQAVSSFSGSLLKSLSPEEVYFGIDGRRRVELEALAKHLSADKHQGTICTDMFSAYYLFFMMRYRGVALPVSLGTLPGYRPAQQDCNFPTPSLQSPGTTSLAH